MILDSFRQDVRVGLRVLFKEKSFCFLATLVLALGILVFGKVRRLEVFRRRVGD